MRYISWENIIEKNLKGIVGISSYIGIKELNEEIRKEGIKKSIPKEIIDRDGRVLCGSGSGFIVHKNGLIVTNKHVVDKIDVEYFIELHNGDKIKAEIVSIDPLEDIAILKIEKDHLQPLKLGDSRHLKLGTPVIAIGNSLGLFSNSIASGMISGLERVLKDDSQKDQPELRSLIQIDAAINPGHSGGPLIDEKGEVVGVVTAIISGASNMSFAIPITTIRRDLSDLLTHGKICRPYLGLKYLEIDDRISNYYNLPYNYGAYVKNRHGKEVIKKDSPAMQAGIRENDIILEINNQKVTSSKNIHDILEEFHPHDTIKVKIRREKIEFNTFIKLGEI